MWAFSLIHSPLVGPLTWALVADELRQRGAEAIAPTLPDARAVSPPYWKRHAEAVAQTLQVLPPNQPLILVGHSGAGPLLPLIREATNLPVAAYIFVDAIIPQNGASRLDLFESREAVEQFRQSAVEGLLPTWAEEDLREVIPDDDLRRRFVSELRPLPLAVYEEPLPVFVGWPDALCGYLRFSPIYHGQAKQARQSGWSYVEIEAGHFHMLVDPEAVAHALFKLAEQLAEKG
jgi:pimeloyl-ACP methyl ester carboxylesterase